MLAEQWGVGAEVWSVTSWGELRRDGVDAEHHNLVHPDAEPRVPYVHEALAGGHAPVVAVSDWMRAVPDQIRQWVPAPFTSAGHRRVRPVRHAARGAAALRVDAESITVAAPGRPSRRRASWTTGVAVEAAAKYRIDDPQAAGPQTSDPGVA